MQNASLFKEYENVFGPEEVSEAKDKREKVFAYSPFALQDAIGDRDVKKIWIEYQKIILLGIEPDEIIHRMISKVRDMAFISKGANQNDLGIKDYPYSKSKRDLKNWKSEDLLCFYEKLISVYHGSRMGKGSVELELEKAILGL